MTPTEKIVNELRQEPYWGEGMNAISHWVGGLDVAILAVAELLRTGQVCVRGRTVYLAPHERRRIW